MKPLPIPLDNRRKWMPDEFEQLIVHGMLGDDRYELIEGDVLRKEERSEPVCVAMCLLQGLLMEWFPSANFCVRNQAFLEIGASAPEPDFAVVSGNVRAQPMTTPTTALLVVEVALRTVVLDRAKSHIYARAGVPEYWIVNLGARQIEVRRDPRADETAPLGWTYGALQTLGASDEIAPLAFPGAKFPVAEVLP